MPPKKAYLTKSRFMAGLQCKKRLWRQCFDPLPYEEPEIGSAQGTGLIVGRMAHRLFPGGVLIDAPPWEHRRARSRTQALLADPAVSAIFEAAFEEDGIRIRVDVLERLSRNRWGLREVKSSTSVKDEYLDDAAIQLSVLEQAGLNVSSIEIVHVNNEYVRGKRGIDWGVFFHRADLTREVKEQLPSIRGNLKEMRPDLQRRTAPDVEPGRHCSRPNDCEFWDQCTSGKPEDWVFYLPRISDKRLNELAKLKIESISKIPDDFGLTGNQDVIRNVLRSKRAYFSDRLKDALKPAGPPAAYLDFETMNPVIPLYPGTRPYERIPFQWSLHSLDARGRLRYQGFLAEGKEDPRLEFAETLVKALADGDCPIVVYSGFEKSILGQLKGLVSSRLAHQIDRIDQRLFDLLGVVRAHTYHPGFDFSHSIKNVAPALAPTIHFDNLEHVADGSAASAVYEQIVSGRLGDGATEADLRVALLEYCRRDTLAMVEVHKALVRQACD